MIQGFTNCHLFNSQKKQSHHIASRFRLKTQILSQGLFLMFWNLCLIVWFDCSKNRNVSKNLFWLRGFGSIIGREGSLFKRLVLFLYWSIGNEKKALSHQTQYPFFFLVKNETLLTEKLNWEQLANLVLSLFSLNIQETKNSFWWNVKGRTMMK